MNKILFLLKNWFKKFLLVRKLNIEFNGKTPIRFSVALAKDTVFKDFPDLKDVVAISFDFDKGPQLAVIFTDDNNEGEFYQALIKSVFAAWPNYKVHGFSVIDFVFRDTISFLEKNKGRKILKLRYTVIPYTI